MPHTDWINTLSAVWHRRCLGNLPLQDHTNSFCEDNAGRSLSHSREGGHTHTLASTVRPEECFNASWGWAHFSTGHKFVNILKRYYFCSGGVVLKRVWGRSMWVLMTVHNHHHQLTAAAPSGSTWIYHMTVLAETTHKEDSLYMQTHQASPSKAHARPEGNLCELMALSIAVLQGPQVVDLSSASTERWNSCSAEWAPLPPTRP